MIITHLKKRAHLMDLNVDNIRNVSRLIQNDSDYSTFKVIISADSIKESVYGKAKFPFFYGIYHGFISQMHGVVCNVKIVKSEYSCTIVQNKYNINKNI